MSRWGLVRSVAWRKVPAGPVQVTACWRWSSAADPVPGLAGRVLGDADEQEGEPAEDDVGADAVLAPVVDGAQVDDLLHVSPAALDFAGAACSPSAMSSAVRCGSEERSRYLPSRFSSALILALSMRRSPPGVTRR